MEPADDLFKRPRSPVRRDRNSGIVPTLNLSDTVALTPAHSESAPAVGLPLPTSMSPRRLSISTKLEYSSKSGPDLGSPARTGLSKSDSGPRACLVPPLSDGQSTSVTTPHVVARSPGKSKGQALMPVDRTKSIYSPRWIVSVKRETDKQVMEFLANLKQPDVQVRCLFYANACAVFRVLCAAH